jgi:hypothetical protein
MRRWALKFGNQCSRWSQSPNSSGLPSSLAKTMRFVIVTIGAEISDKQHAWSTCLYMSASSFSWKWNAILVQAVQRPSFLHPNNHTQISLDWTFYHFMVQWLWETSDCNKSLLILLWPLTFTDVVSICMKNRPFPYLPFLFGNFQRVVRECRKQKIQNSETWWWLSILGMYSLKKYKK